MGGQTQGIRKDKREKAGRDSPQFQRENCGIWCFLVAPRQGEDLTEQVLSFARSGENQLPEGSAVADFISCM